MPQALQVAPFGPLIKGVVSAANATLPMQGAMRYCRNAIYDGIGRLRVRKGSIVALTLQDDQGSPANVTSVCAVVGFSDSALAVGHSTVTNKAYLYRLAGDLTGWFDSGGTLHTTTTPAPVGVLWSSMTAVPIVSIAEGLGVAYIAHAAAADATSVSWPTRVYTQPGTLANLTSDLDGDGTPETLYFSYVISFQQQLWGFSMGQGTTASTVYDPSSARFSKIDFDPTPDPNPGDLFAPGDSFTLGDRVRSQRERVVGAGVAGSALYVGGASLVTRFTGFGRDSWQKIVLDRSYGFAGPRAFATVGSSLYYWSNRGPMRIKEALTISAYVAPGGAEPLWDAIPDTVLAAAHGGDPLGMVAVYDADVDQVQWYYQSAASEGRLRYAAWDVRRDCFLGPDSAVGVSVGCAGFVAPIPSFAAAPIGPTGPPTGDTLITTGAQLVTISFAIADTTATTVIQFRMSGTTPWTTVTLEAGGTTATFSGLTPSTTYNIQYYATKNGQNSSIHSGPDFTTASATCSAPTNIAALSSGVPLHASDSTGTVTWINTEPTASTEVWWKQPGESVFEPIFTAPNGVSSYAIGPVDTTGTYSFEVRHTLSGFFPSSFDGPVTVTLVKYSRSF